MICFSEDIFTSLDLARWCVFDMFGATVRIRSRLRAASQWNDDTSSVCAVAGLSASQPVKNRSRMRWNKWNKAELQGLRDRVLRSQVCWASQFLALHLVCGELCKVVVRWKGRVYRRIWMSACTQHHSWAGHGGLHMWTQHSGGWSRRSTWAIQSNIGSNIKQMLTPKNCCVSEDHVELSRGNNKIYTYLAM